MSTDTFFMSNGFHYHEPSVSYKLRNRYIISLIREVTKELCGDGVVLGVRVDADPGCTYEYGVEKTVSSEDSSPSWQKPPPLFLKCNVGASWDISSLSSGASWIVRDSKGVVLYHSRRAFSCIGSRIQADLTAISWAAEAIRDLKLKRVIFEISSDQAQTALDFPLSFLGNPHVCQRALFAIHAVSEAKLHLVQANCNIIANLIAGSVTRDHRHQSYVARNGPVWLSSQIHLETSS
ncbi:hypothetical protein IGI04_007659 [Brassica rapa subsp. trilocularis]|uniref:RNase H type-1 domain-containing protein n=1 Tax=Brassica rapa subsp. trilocularis TaxID=1813537 RepID=A0ABQ7NMN7_BRACM|nr:hypothetical protein IGI04_007659 [Brassica rapa subsp. trilocularis]